MPSLLCLSEGILQRGNAAKALLFDLIDVLEPPQFHLRSNRDGRVINLEFWLRIDAVAVEDELGERSVHEEAMVRWTLRLTPADLFLARRRCENALKVLMSVWHDSSSSGLCFGCIFLRPDSAYPDES